jgi:nucleotide-binding universal stress UspA family protein
MYRRHSGASDTTPIHDIARGMLQDQLAAFRAASTGIEEPTYLELIVADGVPETRIPELASLYGASMIVMCSHNRRGLRRWLHGSVTEAVIRNAACPVVLVGREDGSPVSALTVHSPALSESSAAHGV